jgi:IclR family transcriptional regulator, acetate operon repressor
VEPSVQSLERAFAILDAVADRPAGVTAIATRVGLPKSTVARLLQALARLGAVERGEGATWQVGPALAKLAALASAERSLAALARPQLVELVHAVGEDAGLGLPDGYLVHYVDQVESENAVQVRNWTGTRAPLHTTPSGLVILAEWPQDALDAYLGRELERLTPKTETVPGRLRRRLVHVREQGYAWGREEFVEGISSVAAPVRGARGKVVAAIHAHGPAYRFPPSGREEAIARHVAAAAAEVTRLLAREAA